MLIYLLWPGLFKKFLYEGWDGIGKDDDLSPVSIVTDDEKE